MQNFAYHRPRSLADTVATLAEAAKNGDTGEAKLLAGGQSLLPVMKLDLAAPTDLVSIRDLPELQGIRRDGDRLVIGAAVTHAEVHASPDVAAAIPALAQLAGTIGDPQVRNRGTLGGSIAHNDPAADYPAALIALDAVVKTHRRELSAQDFFTGMFETALEPGEIIVEVSFAVPERAAYAKFPNPASRFAVVGVMVAKHAGGVRVAVTGAGPCVFRLTEMEERLARSFTADAIAGVTVAADDLTSDMHAGPEYRAHLVTVMATRALAAAS